MAGFVVRRCGQAVAVLFLVTAATLGLVRLFPGGPVHALLGARATPGQISYYDRLYGFNQPFFVQYGKWAVQLLRGNLGFSDRLNLPVATLIAQDLPRSAVLAALGTLVSLLAGIPLGVYQATRRGRVADHLLTGLSFLSYSTPGFFVAIMLVDWFAVDLRVFPPFAPQSSSVIAVLGQPRALVLPVVTYAFLQYPVWSRYLRASLIENLAEDYVRAVRAKGASERRVLWLHAVRNSLLPVVTLLGLSVPGLAGGAVVLEVVFNYPGMGLAFYQAALSEDFPVLLGFTVLAAVATIAGNLLADLAYAALDPRVRY